MTSGTKLLQTVRVRIFLITSLATLLLTSCNERPLKVGVANWKPQSTGGPIETRPLPPAQLIHSNYQQWSESETTAKVRLYELVLVGATNQSNFTVKVQRGDTPLGAAETTSVTFDYDDRTNGTYRLEWNMRGRHQPDFLKVDDHPKRVWLQLLGSPGERPYPRLQIVAIESVEPRSLLVAEPGAKTQ